MSGMLRLFAVGFERNMKLREELNTGVTVVKYGLDNRNNEAEELASS